MAFQPLDSKVLGWCIRLGGVISLLLSSSYAMAVEGECLCIAPVKEQQTMASLEAREIADNKLVEVLQGYIQSEGTIEKPDLVGFAVNGSGAEQGSSSSEGEEHFVQLSKAPRKASRVTQKGRNISRHPRRKNVIPRYQATDHYVKAGEKMPTPLSLANDAKKIHEAQHSSQSRGGTTILCVALRDYNGHVRRFVFCNHSGSMPLNCFKIASDLGYDEGNSGHAHAEGQFLDFLYERNKEFQRYTHIVGIGCSRPHCAECDCVLQLMLGTNYQTITAAAIEKERSREVTAVNAPLDEKNPHVTLTKQEKVEYDLVTQDEAVSERIYLNYAIPDALKEKIAQQAGIQVTSWGEKYASKTNKQVLPAPASSQGKKRRVA